MLSLLPELILDAPFYRNRSVIPVTAVVISFDFVLEVFAVFIPVSSVTLLRPVNKMMLAEIDLHTSVIHHRSSQSVTGG